MTVWIVTSDAAVAGLLGLADGVGGGGGTDGVRVVLADPAPGVPVEALASAVARAVAAGPGDVVLAPDRPAERVLAAAVAVALGAPVLSGVTGFRDGAFEVSRYGGICVDTVALGPTLVAIAEGGATVSELVPDVTVSAPDNDAVTVVEQSVGERPADLAEASRVVAIGRDLASDVELARGLAEAVGAELAGSRPVAEALGWGHDRCVGASGVTIAPEVYVALGISGQLQHLSGCLGSSTIVTVNADASAPIWAHSDYGIVGDARVVVPALIVALQPVAPVGEP